MNVVLVNLDETASPRQFRMSSTDFQTYLSEVCPQKNLASIHTLRIIVGIPFWSQKTFFLTNSPCIFFQVMPDHHPSCVEIAEKLHVQYEVWYDVMHAPKDLAEKLADEIQSESYASMSYEHAVWS
jgi:hypothetical protein